MILGIPFVFLFVAFKMYCWNDATLYVFMKHAKYSSTTQPTYCNATTGFPAKWNLRIKCKNSILMTCYFSELDIPLIGCAMRATCDNQSKALS